MFCHVDLTDGGGGEGGSTQRLLCSFSTTVASEQDCKHMTLETQAGEKGGETHNGAAADPLAS